MKRHGGDHLSPIVVILLLVITTLVYAQAPNIGVTPDSLCDTLSTGEISSQWLTISNTGSSDLVFYTWVEGSGNYALQFDGLNDYAEVPDDAALSAIGDAFTLEVWLKVDESSSWIQTILAKWGPGFDWDDEYALEIRPLQMMELTLSGSSGQSIVFSPFQFDTCIHVAGVFDAVKDSLKLYINGTLASSTTPVIASMDRDTDEPFHMGGTGYDDTYYDGQIDEVRLWNIARTQNEIQQDMYKQLTGAEPGLIGYWRLNEGSGNVVHDSSSNNNDGIVYGGANWAISPVVLNWLCTTPSAGIVPADSSMDIEVTFDATNLWGGNYYQELVILSNDPDEPEIIVPARLHVRGTPNIAVSDDTLDFGVVFVGASASENLILSNEGDAWLIVSDISSNNSDYTVDVTNFSIAPGLHQEVLVTFTPSSAGVSIGILTITSNDPDEPTITIVLLGAGMTGIAQGEMALPKFFSLSRASPNPFSKQTITNFACPYQSIASVEIFDLTGRLVKTLLDGKINAGYHIVRWNGMDNADNRVPAGVYFLRFKARDYAATQKLLLIR